MLNKNDPLIGAVQEVMKRNHAEREAARLVNEKFGVTDRKALPHEKQGAWDAAYKTVLTEGAKALDEASLPKPPTSVKAVKDLGMTERKSRAAAHKAEAQRYSDIYDSHQEKGSHGTKAAQSALDKKVHHQDMADRYMNPSSHFKNEKSREKDFTHGGVKVYNEDTEALDEKVKMSKGDIAALRHPKKKITSHDLDALRAGEHKMEEQDSSATQPSKMGLKPDYAPAGTTPDYAKPTSQTVNRAAKTSMPAGTVKEENLEEKAVSKAQRNLMGAALSAKRGGKPLSPKVAEIASSMSTKELRKFAGTREKGLPEKKKMKIDEGFNNRHDLSVTASAEKQVVAEQLNEAGGVNFSKTRNAVTPVNVSKNKISNPFIKSNINYKSQAVRAKYKAALATGKTKSIKPTGELKADNNYTLNKYRDKAETFARAATGDVGDVVGITDPKRGEGLRKFNPGAAQAGDLAGIASMMLPGRGALGASTKAVSTASKVEKGTSIIPKIAKAEGQGNRLAAARRLGSTEGPWGAPSTAAAKAATTSAEKFKARANAMRRQVAGAEPKVIGAAEKAKAPTMPNAAAANASRVARTNVRPATPNAAAANASRIRTAVGKAFNSTVNTARLVGGPSGPSSGSSIGTPSTAAAAPVSKATAPSSRVAMTARKIEATPRKVSDTEIMNAPQYKQAVKAVGGEAGARRIQAGTDVAGVGKVEKGQTIWSKVKSQLEKQPVKGFEMGANKGGAGR